MATHTILTTLPGADRARALGEALERLDPAPEGVGVFEIEDDSGLWEVGAYVDGPPDPVALALLKAAFGVSFALSEIPDVDWVAHVRRELSPVEAGRFVVHGSHDADRVPEGRTGLLIEASMAFGTGHHGTTLGCLLAIEALSGRGFAPGRVLDLGCGTAVLAMAAVHAFGVDAVASDIDSVAVDVARVNVAANGLDGRVRCLVAEGFGDPELDGPWHLVLANILMGPLIDLAPDMAARQPEGGMAVLSGILNEQADRTAAAFEAAGYMREGTARHGDWTTLTMRRL
ncbi:MAG: 50S ribosomal protein L11 methyltransferase [Paracoccaceae bacterium]